MCTSVRAPAPRPDPFPEQIRATSKTSFAWPTATGFQVWRGWISPNLAGDDVSNDYDGTPLIAAVQSDATFTDTTSPRPSERTRGVGWGAGGTDDSGYPPRRPVRLYYPCEHRE
jgi:hypothetical protein